jgi:peptidoglycan/LPS O-acetylase OafA/YrhL
MWLPTGKRRRGARSLILIFIAIACWVVYGSLIHIIEGNNNGLVRWFATNPMAVRHSVVAHLPNFFLAMAFSRQVFDADVMKYNYRIGNDVVMVLLVTAMAWIGLISDEKDITFWNGRYCFPILPILLMFLISLCSSGYLITSILRWKPFVWLGRISFPFYLVHHLVLIATLFAFHKFKMIQTSWLETTFIFIVGLSMSLILAFLLKQMNYSKLISNGNRLSLANRFDR